MKSYQAGEECPSVHAGLHRVHEVSAPISVVYLQRGPLARRRSEVGAAWRLRNTGGAKSTRHITSPKGWPQPERQESARPKAVIDDEALPRFYWACSAACLTTTMNETLGICEPTPPPPAPIAAFVITYSRTAIMSVQFLLSICWLDR